MDYDIRHTAFRLLVFFRNGEVRIVRTEAATETHPECQPYLINEDRFCSVEVQPDGYGIMWSERAVLSDRELYENGDSVPLSLEDFITFVRHRIVNTGEAGRILGCSRQNIDDLTRRGKLHPIRQDEKNKLFLRNEVIQRKQQYWL